MNRIQRVSAKLQSLALMAGLLAMSVVGTAQAALPTGVSTVFTGVSDNAEDLFELAWPVFLIIIGGLITFKLVKKVIGKVA
jgi:hypothetical protein